MRNGKTSKVEYPDEDEFDFIVTDDGLVPVRNGRRYTMEEYREYHARKVKEYKDNIWQI